MSACGTRVSLPEIESLHVEIDGKGISKGADLALNAGEVHAIIGPNGSAKVDILAQAPAQEIFT